MGAITSIQFAHHTWNPWRGCEHAKLPDGSEHPGCKNCYAERMAKLNPSVLGEWGPYGKRTIGKYSYMRLPYQWNKAAEKARKRRRVFLSLLDPFEDRPDLVEPRQELFRTIDDCQHLDWLLFTKRPQNIRRLWVGGRRENVWLLYSASDQPSLEAYIGDLLACRDLVPVLGLSLEPLLGLVDLSRWLDRCSYYCDHGEIYPECHRPERSQLDWVIVGGESDPGARQCDLAWIRSIRDQCGAAGVKCFVKQLGSQPIGWHNLGATGVLRFADKKGGDPAEWPVDLRVRELPDHRRRII